MLGRGAPSGFRFFPVNSRAKLLFQHVHVHFTCPCAFYIAQGSTKTAARAFLGLGARHFSCNFARKMALVRCPSAFLQRRLAQSVGRGLIMVLAWAFFFKIFAKNGFPSGFLALAQMALVTCPCPCRPRRLAQSVGRGLIMVLGRGISPEDCRVVKWFL